MSDWHHPFPPLQHHQIVMVSGRPADLGFNTVNQISLIADSLTELKKIHVSLKGRKDVAELRTVTHGNAVSIYFRDPLLLLYFKKERVVNAIPSECLALQKQN